MCRKMLLVLGTLCFFSQALLGKNYAILISGGYGRSDNNDVEARYWPDLVLAYEYLVENAGYCPEDIFVFFGNGENYTQFTVNNNRYVISRYYTNWADTNVVDFPNNDPDSFENSIIHFAEDVLTARDNLLIWITSAHGMGRGGPNDDNYSMAIYPYDGSETWFLTEIRPEPGFIYKIIYDLFNNFRNSDGSPKYKRVKYLWSTCRSGHLLVGNKTLLNGGGSYDDDEWAVAFTACNYNETAIVTFQRPNNGDFEPHSGFTYAIYCTLKGQDPWGGEIDFQIRDQNGDGVISMKELFDAISNNGNQCFWRISWDNRGTHPQYSDPGINLECFYIDEVLKLKNCALTMQQEESVRKYRVDKIIAGPNLTIPSGSNIEFIADTEVKLNWVHSEKGSRLHIIIEP